ncbi:MAG: relaxase/mobilization nuclease domain-containing protein [Oscillospiraceae bacterium]|nr:relaxase/mobilization nuclease domain-containing protein [Oscillospiraceae bacterium]
MPVIIENSIHASPKKLIEYILNPDKNEEMEYVSGICCHHDADAAFEGFRDIYERYAHEKFQGKNNSRDSDLPKGKKRETVLIFHYIQSFAPGEVSPKLAHKIGKHWIHRMCGSKRTVLLSTHCDKDHVHNHFAVSVFENDGKRWYANKTSLKRCRDVSDKLAKEYCPFGNFSFLPKLAITYELLW